MYVERKYWRHGFMSFCQHKPSLASYTCRMFVNTKIVYPEHYLRYELVTRHLLRFVQSISGLLVEHFTRFPKISEYLSHI